ncbi:transposase [Streptomyces sp. NPDC057280]|uniref:transposase n=1 Tax=Streptomyces sp. NPDC057280 TaxID=3346081 RepID=UPI0036389502
MGTATADHRSVKTEDHAVAVGHRVEPACWQEAFEALMGRIAGRFARVEPRRRVRDLVRGLLLTCHARTAGGSPSGPGEATPGGMQHLFGPGRWDADQVREYVLEHLRDEDAVLAVDETGDVKKGIHTVEVQRQYTGTAGRIENTQVAINLVYAGSRGHAAVDRELYIPRALEDPEGTVPAHLPGIGMAAHLIRVLALRDAADVHKRVTAVGVDAPDAASQDAWFRLQLLGDALQEAGDGLP